MELEDEFVELLKKSLKNHTSKKLGKMLQTPKTTVEKWSRRKNLPHPVLMQWVVSVLHNL